MQRAWLTTLTDTTAWSIKKRLVAMGTPYHFLGPPLFLGLQPPGCYAQSLVVGPGVMRSSGYIQSATPST